MFTAPKSIQCIPTYLTWKVNTVHCQCKTNVLRSEKKKKELWCWKRNRIVLVSGSECFAWPNQLIIFKVDVYELNMYICFIMMLCSVLMVFGASFFFFFLICWSAQNVMLANWNIYVYIVRCIHDDVSDSNSIYLLYFFFYGVVVVLLYWSQWNKRETKKKSPFFFSLLSSINEDEWMSSMRTESNEWMWGFFYYSLFLSVFFKYSCPNLRNQSDTHDSFFTEWIKRIRTIEKPKENKLNKVIIGVMPRHWRRKPTNLYIYTHT